LAGRPPAAAGRLALLTSSAYQRIGGGGSEVIANLLPEPESTASVSTSSMNEQPVNLGIVTVSLIEIEPV